MSSHHLIWKIRSLDELSQDLACALLKGKARGKGLCPGVLFWKVIPKNKSITLSIIIRVSLGGAKLIHRCDIKLVNHWTARNWELQPPKHSQVACTSELFLLGWKRVVYKGQLLSPSGQGLVAPRVLATSHFQDCPVLQRIAHADIPSEGSIREEGKRCLVHQRRHTANYTGRQLVTMATVRPNCRLRGCKVEHKVHFLQGVGRSSMCLFNVYHYNQQNQC